MGIYHNDQPIQGTEESPDLLNRSKFAKYVSNILVQEPSQDCFTVSLEASWGAGKTSTINLIKKELREQSSSPLLFEYNPWMAGKPEVLIQDFLIQLSSSLSLTDSSREAKKAAKELLAYSSLFSVAKLIPGAEPWASLLGKVTSTVGKSTEDIAKLKELSLLEKKYKVLNAIAKLKKSIVIIIDDIDRLTPSETFQVLRLVKAVADFPGTTFLLSFDENYLTQVLAGNSIVNSAEYIDKIIQLRISLPVISEEGMVSLANYELRRLSENELTNRFEDDQDRLSWCFHKYFKILIRNPRELKRFFNHLRFVLIQIEGQVAFSDLFVLSLLAIKANKIYEHIKNSPEAYIGRSIFGNDLESRKREEIVELFENERDQQLSEFDIKTKSLVKELLGEVFPLLGESTFGGATSTVSQDAAGRISTPQRLYTALHYDTPIGFISDNDILAFIRGELDRNAFVEQAFVNESFERFLELLNHQTKLFGKDTFELLKSIFDVTLQSNAMKESQESNYGFANQDLYRKLCWLADSSISCSDEKYPLLKMIIEHTENAPISAYLLDRIRSQLTEPETNGDSWCDEQELDELSKIYEDIACRSLKNSLFKETHLETKIFFAWKRCSEKSISSYINSLLKNDNGIFRFAEIISYGSTDSSNGPYFQMKDEVYSEIVDLHKLRNLVSAIDLDKQPISLQAVFNSILDGNSYYLRDGTFNDWG